MKISKLLFKGGTNFPGKIALKLDKNILKTISKDYTVILVTGTNGKTTTTSMIYTIMKQNGTDVITNSSGANMLPGIISCFIENYKFKQQSTNRYAVIEVDEANVKLVTDFINPKIITITNLFRDQLDRFRNVNVTLEKILSGIYNVPEATLILNGDEPLLGDLKLPNKTLYYGFNCPVETKKEVDINSDSKFCKNCKEPYKYNFITYSHLGDFYCEKCLYKRPALDYSVDKILDINKDESLIVLDDKKYYINQPGIYNIYNALCAYSVSKTLNIENSIIFNGLKNSKISFGRQESIFIDDKETKIILVKNPAGFNEAINTVALDDNSISVAIILNDNYGDSRDVSWIWDADIEKLNDIEVSEFMVSGIRTYDIAIRLRIAGIDKEKLYIAEDYEKLLKNIKNTNASRIYVLATYTAMMDFRKFLNKKGYIKRLW